MTRRYGSTLGLNNANPYKPPHTLQKFVIPRERSDRGNLPEGESVVPATNGIFYNYSCPIVSVSTAGDFTTNARNDIATVWFYNVISTGVKTTD